MNRTASELTGLLLALLAMVVLFSVTSEHFWSVLTLTTIANQMPSLIVVSVGMTFVLIVAGIDLSVGSVMALAGAILGVCLVDFGFSLWLAALACLLCGLLCGLFNGTVVTMWRVPSFIVTLGMLEIARGGAYLVTGSQTRYIGSTVEVLSNPVPYTGLSPSWFIAIAVVALGELVLRGTVLGRYAVAVGSNEDAALLAGVRTRRIKLSIFAIAGALSGLAGLFHVAYLQSADPNAGVGLELSAIAAVVIGGTSLSGGKGSVINTFLGVAIIAVLQTGLAQIGASEPGKRVITGAVIIAAVLIDVYRRDGGDIRQWLSRVVRR